MDKFYITTSSAYVNSKPHIGYAYELVFADVIARWNRLKGDDVFFVTGTDENAQKNAQAAKENNLPVRDFVDKNASFFVELTKILNITNDSFVRSTEKRHIKVAQDIFNYVYKKGDIYKGFYEGYYCLGCEAFLSENDLVNEKCVYHNKVPEFLKEESYFFRMSKYKDKILKLLNKNGFIKPERYRKEIYKRVVRDQLKDLSVSRFNKQWGITVPIDPNHKIYVWFDALLYYLSALDYPDGINYNKFWPADIQIIGKDILWFHAVIWPSILMAADIPLPKMLGVHGFITVEGQKMSKSIGNVIDPFDIIMKYGVDAVRYYLICEIPFGDDGDFSIRKFKERVNGELVKELGNLVSRSLKLTEKIKGKIEGKAELKFDLKKINKCMEKAELHHVLDEIFLFIKDMNRYINSREPWKLTGSELSNVVYNLCEGLRILSILLSAFLPGTSEKICSQLGLSLGSLKDCQFKKFEGKPKIGEHLFEMV